MIRALRRSLLVGLASGLLAGCLSPTLPLPPPSPPDAITATDEAGVYELQGSAPSNSLVTAYNLNNGLTFGQLVRSDGRYRFRVRGTEGDTIELWYSQRTEESQSTTFELEPRGTP